MYILKELLHMLSLFIDSLDMKKRLRLLTLILTCRIDNKLCNLLSIVNKIQIYIHMRWYILYVLIFSLI